VHSLAKGRHPEWATLWLKLKCTLMRAHHPLITTELFLNRLDRYRREFLRERFATNAEYDFRPPNSAFILYHLA
jgi:hypothetical protein